MEIYIDFYAQIAAAVSLGFVWIATIRSYLRDVEKDKLKLALAIGYAFFDLSTIAASFRALLVLGNLLSEALLATRFMYIFVSLGLVPFAYFVIRLFFTAQRNWAIYAITGLAVAFSIIFLFVPSSVILVETTPIVFNTDTLTGLALLTTTLTIFAIMAIRCFQAARVTDEAKIRRRFKLLGLAGIFGVLVFVFNAVNVLVEPSISPYTQLATWIFVAGAGVSSYLGWVRLK